MLFLQSALSPRVLPIWLDAGVPGIILGFACPLLLFQVLAMLVGFYSGIFIISRFLNKQQMQDWLFGGKEPRPKFVNHIVKLASR